MSVLGVPIVTVVTGEGGSGGALAIGVVRPPADAPVQHLLGDLARGLRLDPVAQRGQEEAAAEALGITAGRLKQLGLIDELLEEPLGGAHRDPAATAASLKEAVIRHLDELEQLSPEELLARRAAKISGFGVFSEDGTE